jgi:hypothetical protein
VNGDEFPERFSPDGLTEQVIDVLLREVEVVAMVRPRAASVVVDGVAVRRRWRRGARRSVAAVVRALPMRDVAAGPDGREAA